MTFQILKVLESQYSKFPTLNNSIPYLHLHVIFPVMFLFSGIPLMKSKLIKIYYERMHSFTRHEFMSGEGMH